MKKFIIRNLVFIASLCFLTFLLTFILVVNMNDKVEKQLESQIKQLNIEKTERINKESYYKEVENKYFEIMGNKKAEEIVKVYEEENIKLQNTIKEWAALGVKPQNYEIKSPISRGDIIDRKKLQYVGNLKTTFYCPDILDCQKNDGITYSGDPVIPGYTIAADIRYFPINTRLLISGIGYGIVKDIGGAVKGKDILDICTFNRKLSDSGCTRRDVYIIKE